MPVLFEWMIEDIIPAHPDLYLEHCAAMAVAAMAGQSTSDCTFEVICSGFTIPDLGADPSFELRVRWSEELLVRSTHVRRTEQTRPIVERASVALAALLLAHFIPGSQLRVTRQGDRADYWLPKLGHALEVSGTESPREVRRRRREKREQLLANPLGWGGYVVVCCFSERRRLIDWSYHTPPGGESNDHGA